LESGEIVGKGCSACGECVLLRTAGPEQPYKWVSIGVVVDSVVRSFGLTVAWWKLTPYVASGVNLSPLLAYDDLTSSLVVGGFAVSDM